MKIKFLNKLNKNKIVAMEKGKVIGYLTFSYPKDTAGKRNINWDYLYVKPICRRKGIGTKLMRFALHHFRNVVWISFWTGEEAEKNKIHDWFKRLGFRQLAYQPDYYKKGVGTRLFVKRMK